MESNNDVINYFSKGKKRNNSVQVGIWLNEYQYNLLLKNCELLKTDKAKLLKFLIENHLPYKL